MLRTGQVPTEVNAMPGPMPGLVTDESEGESKEIEDGINAMQSGDACFFCKRPGHMKKDCRKYKTGKRRTLAGKPEVVIENRFPVITVARRDIFLGNARVKGRILEGEITAVPEADRWQRWPNPWQIYRKC